MLRRPRAQPSDERNGWDRKCPRKERAATLHYALPREADQEFELVRVREQIREARLSPPRIPQPRGDVQHHRVYVQARSHDEALLRLRGGAGLVCECSKREARFGIWLEDRCHGKAHLADDRELPLAAA